MKKDRFIHKTDVSGGKTIHIDESLTVTQKATLHKYYTFAFSLSLSVCQSGTHYHRFVWALLLLLSMKTD